MGQIDAGIGTIGIEDNRTMIGLDGLIEPASFPECVPQVAHIFRVVRMERDGTTVCRNRLVKLSFGHQRISEIAKSAGKLGVKREGAPACGDCLIKSTADFQNVSEIAMGDGEVGVQCDRPPTQGDAFIELPVVSQAAMPRLQ